MCCHELNPTQRSLLFTVSSSISFKTVTIMCMSAENLLISGNVCRYKAISISEASVFLLETNCWCLAVVDCACMESCICHFA